MKRRFVCALFILTICATGAFTQEIEPAVTFGMPFGIGYKVDQTALSIFNIRYHLGFDLQFRVAPALYIGGEAGAVFGFVKDAFDSPNFKEIFVDFPLRLVVLYRLPGVVLELFTGGIYIGNAVLPGGYLYMENIKFSLNYEIGGRIGFGDTSFFFIEAAKTFGPAETLRIGIGVRLGLL
jgi:hypothetical protein